ncbi:unnamed protein product [Cylicocyclus nassatus]|uniref:Uncharacterized protein n=1 Tax=Cylicocyclus nassatus TaxID=53992 RepID=A0AA36DM61_CYLNA|nr:unnamed protein product [Cylicocyclus nassatus]
MQRSMRVHQLSLFCCLLLCYTLVQAQFGWRCGYVGGWCDERWRFFDHPNGFRSKALMMAALARSVRANVDAE